ncbi:hypothetical protein CMT52_11285 [Elizabethkingia anophelis]|nr:hypothetical protein [Elizabethkingia anophelis]
MGTRNLTMVINQEGVTKVAQYGQWDGYPSGVGLGVLNFLKDKELFEKFKSKLDKVRFLDKEGQDKEFIESYNNNTPEWSNETDNRTEEQKRWWATYCHRDLSEEVLTNIANSEDEEIILLNREETGKSDGWVEWSYIVNLKENMLHVHEHIDVPPIKSFSLDNLPTQDEFLKLEQLEETEE